MQKLILFPIASTLVGIGLIAVALQGETTVQMTSAIAGQRSYEVTGFDKVSAAGPMHVLVTVGPATSVRAEGPNETLDGYEVEVGHGSLQIKPKRHNFWNSSWKELKPATFRVTVPRLSTTSIAGSGDMKVDRVDGKKFAASVAGSGALTAHGRAGKANVSIAGSGNMHLHKLASDDANVSIVGSGNAALTVRDDGAVSVIGSGEVDVAGPAHCSVSRFGGGRVRCGGQLQGGEDG